MPGQPLEKLNRRGARIHRQNGRPRSGLECCGTKRAGWFSVHVRVSRDFPASGQLRGGALKRKRGNLPRAASPWTNDRIELPAQKPRHHQCHQRLGAVTERLPIMLFITYQHLSTELISQAPRPVKCGGSVPTGNRDRARKTPDGDPRYGTPSPPGPVRSVHRRRSRRGPRCGRSRCTRHGGDDRPVPRNDPALP